MKTFYPNPLVKSFLIILFVFFVAFLNAQNTVVTDSSTYNADASAVLDVQSVHKGFLVPRMSTSQREDISNPAEGLLVFDLTLHEFYVYSNSSWQRIESNPLWLSNKDSVYVTGDGVRVGVGTKSPMGRFIVQGDSTAVDEPLFEVKNSDGYSIFAVYEDSVSINFIESSKGVKGGFAVGGLTPGKSAPRDYLRITPDSVRVYVDTSQSKGVKGGFAVGGLTPGKSSAVDLLKVTDDSVLVYFNDISSNQSNGFKVRGLSNTTQSRGLVDVGNQGTDFSVFATDATSTFYDWKVYTEDYSKTISPFSAFYSGDDSVHIGLMNINNMTDKLIFDVSFTQVWDGKSGPLNDNEKPGESNNLKNSKASETGSMLYVSKQNVYAGYNAGWYSWKTDLGNNYDNVFIGNNAGLYTEGGWNVFIGAGACEKHDVGNMNVAIGCGAGYFNGQSSNGEGSGNVFLGYRAGHYETGSNKLYITNDTHGPTSALIYGEFPSSEFWSRLRINASLEIGNFYDNSSSGGVGSISLFEDVNNGENFIKLVPPADLAADVVLTLPVNDGDAGQFLQTDGDGNLSWATPAKISNDKEDNGANGAFIVPRMTEKERDALVPVDGMIIYNLTTNQFNFRENGSWVTK